MKEIWKEIEGFEAYSISNMGRLRRTYYKGTSRILQPCMTVSGLTATLTFRGRRRNISIHRLVAEYFMCNGNNLSDVIHKNGDKSDNRVSNLKFVSWYDVGYGRKPKRVLQIDKSGKIVEEWDSVASIRRKTKYGQGNISNCCNGKARSAYGYYWVFKDNFGK